MIRSLALAAAAAAVGYAVGQRAAESPERRFECDRPTESGVGVGVDPEEVVFEDGEVTLADDARRHKSSDIENPYDDWERFGDADGRIGR